jgi:hypothetical protein
MIDDFSPFTGRCMCGAVEVSTTAQFVGALFCHCKRCQRRSGTTRSMTALCPAGAFSVTAGEDKVRVWDPGDGWLKAFCVDCGSHTHTISPDDPTLVAIRLGCLDQDPGSSQPASVNCPASHVYAAGRSRCCISAASGRARPLPARG